MPLAPDQGLVGQVAVGLEELVQVGPLHRGGQRVVRGQEGRLVGVLGGRAEARVLPQRAAQHLEVLRHAAERLLGLLPAALGDNLRTLLHDPHLHPAPHGALRRVGDGAASRAGDSPSQLLYLAPLLLQVGRRGTALRKLARVPAQALDGVGEVLQRDPAHVGHLKDVARCAPEDVGSQLRSDGPLMLEEAIGRLLSTAPR
mmetsp:Transcript_7197/g.23013  ORF Transcript_7197/g.23013 Transcript_7197/m.23013 type:complete len:201 (-) Transcript_7197:400-1002(-)